MTDKARKKRCPSYKDWVSNDKLVLVQGWARSGLTNEQIANNCGISITTLYKWQSEHAEFADALKMGKEVTDFMVENALFRNAMNGNVTAQIFWLKNRKPSEWRDKPEVNANLDIDEAIKSWIAALKDA